MLCNSSRVHYCMSPLLFSPEWRAQVAHIRRPQDMVQEAMDDLNRLLIKRWNAATVYVPVMAVNKQSALETILLERRKELLMRGLRWIDIKRLNKEGHNIVQKRVVNNVVYTLPANDPRYALPIPIDIIRATGMAQN